jgi:hypothetical protein
MKANRVLLMSLALLSMPTVEADKWVYGAAYQFETGNYSQPQDTDIVTVPVYLNYYTDSWGFGIEIPYVSVSGSSEIIPSSSGQSTGHGKQRSSTGTSTSSYTREGIGDVTIFVSYALPSDDTQNIFYEISAAVKLATADESENLGTGENDYSVKLNISSQIDNWSPALNIGYQITGDNDSTELNNVFFYSLGSRYQWTDTSSISMNYNFKQALSNDSDDSSSIGFNYIRMLNRYYDLGFGLTAGLGEDDADYGLSIFFTGYY